MRKASGIVCILAHVVLVLDAVWGADVRLDVPLIRQKKNGCGAATVAMVVDYWAKQHPGLALPSPDLETIHRQLYSSAAGGILLSDMKRYFQERGFHALTLRASWEELEGHLYKGRPVVAGLKKGPRAELHFVVLAGLQGERVLINDPARRKPRALKRAAFEKQWTAADRWVLLAVPQ